jgi:tetratricopeptide (TPR) repeat protein
MEVTVMTSTDTLFNEGKNKFETGHPEESIKLFTEAEEKGCNPVNVFLSRGAVYLIIGQLDKAINDLNRVLAIDMDNERAFYYRGVANLMQGEFVRAVSDLSKSITINHERGAVFFARGLAFAELDHTDEALRDFKTAIAFSNVEVEGFAHMLGENRTLFGKSMALIEGDRGPLSMVLNEDEVNKLNKWIEN